MSPPTTFGELVKIFTDLIGMALPLLVGLSVLVFFFGLVKFISRVGGDVKAVEEGKKLMIWGLAALFVMVSIWGILRFFYGGIGFSEPFDFPWLPQ